MLSEHANVRVKSGSSYITLKGNIWLSSEIYFQMSSLLNLCGCICLSGALLYNVRVFCVCVCLQVKKMSSSSRALLFALALTLYVVEIASAETLCGGELVDALQFVCEDRGFYFSRFPTLHKFLHNELHDLKKKKCLSVVRLRTSVWIAETISLCLWLCGMRVWYFLSHAHARTHTHWLRESVFMCEREREGVREITASCVSQDLVQAALLSVRILLTAHTSHCI